MSRLLLVEQRARGRALQPWLVSRSGERIDGQDHDARIRLVHDGLGRHPAAATKTADACSRAVQDVLAALHEPAYLSALAGLPEDEPALLQAYAAPGMAPDTPALAPVATAAFEGLRTAISAAGLVLDGERFAYALCRPPGHHAGPAWMGGCCYFNNAAAAALTLRAGGVARVAILDLDIHYPNGTSAMLSRLGPVPMRSLHSWPVVNTATLTAWPCAELERVVEFPRAPDERSYLRLLDGAVQELADVADAIVVSLGFDTIRGDPLGDWEFEPAIFRSVGALLAGSSRPLCLVQEGGYALARLTDCAEAFADGLLGGGG